MLFIEINEEALKAVLSRDESMEMDNQALERREPLLVYLLRSFFAIAQ